VAHQDRFGTSDVWIQAIGMTAVFLDQ